MSLTSPRLKGLIAALCAAGVIVPGIAEATPGVTYIGSEINTSTSTTATITTTADAPAGQPIVIACGTGGSGWTASDSAGNSYTLANTVSYNSTGKLIFFHKDNPVDLPIGGTITINWTSAVRQACVAGTLNEVNGAASPLDLSGTGNQALTGTSGSYSTGTLGQANEVIVGFNSIVGSPGTYTPAPGFTQLTSPAFTSVTNIAWDYETVSSTASVTYNPTWTTSHVWGVNTYTFKATPATGHKTMMLLGVGQ